MNTDDQDHLVELTADIVAAYVSNNPVQTADIGGLIGEIHNTLTALSTGNSAAAPKPLVPAVPIKKSIHDDYIVCLEDGMKFKSLKRHIGVHFGLTPDEYREKWGLPANYPMVAPGYSARRSELALKLGLGRKGSPAAPKRGRKSK